MDQLTPSSRIDWQGKSGGIVTGIVVNVVAVSVLAFVFMGNPTGDIRWLGLVPASNLLVIVAQLLRGQRRFAWGVVLSIPLLLGLVLLGYVLVALVVAVQLLTGGKIGG